MRRRMVSKRQRFTWSVNSKLKMVRLSQFLTRTKRLVTKCCWMPFLVSQRRRWSQSLRRFKRSKTRSSVTRQLICCSCKEPLVLVRHLPCYNAWPTCYTVTVVTWRLVKLWCSHQTNCLMTISTKCCLNWVSKTWCKWRTTNMHHVVCLSCSLRHYKSVSKRNQKALKRPSSTWRVPVTTSTRWMHTLTVWTRPISRCVQLSSVVKKLFQRPRLKRFTTHSTRTTSWVTVSKQPRNVWWRCCRAVSGRKCKRTGLKLKSKTWRRNNTTQCWGTTHASLSLMKKRQSSWPRLLWRMLWHRLLRVLTATVSLTLTINSFTSCVRCQSWWTCLHTGLRWMIGKSLLRTQSTRWRMVNCQWLIWHHLCCCLTWLRVAVVSVISALSSLMKFKTTRHSNWPSWSLASHARALRCWVTWTKPSLQRKMPLACKKSCHTYLIQRSLNMCNWRKHTVQRNKLLTTQRRSWLTVRKSMPSNVKVTSHWLRYCQIKTQWLRPRCHNWQLMMQLKRRQQSSLRHWLTQKLLMLLCVTKPMSQLFVLKTNAWYQEPSLCLHTWLRD